MNPSKNIIFATGPAGTGKTSIACKLAFDTFRNRDINKIILTRPTVAVDEDIGYLPGNLDDKLHPWTQPMFDVFDDLENNAKMKIEVLPLGYMRGRTFKNTWIIGDEMQNSTPNQMKMLLTRLGENSKIIITGDMHQSDLKDENGLHHFLSTLNGMDLQYVSHVELHDVDIHRHPAIKEILKVYDNACDTNTCGTNTDIL
jgi:phosphate starvation-inducible PhoH-like protein